MNLTTQIITLNNEKQIIATLDSLHIDSHILVCDMGSTDRTIEICKDFNCNVVSLKGSRSDIRNKLFDISKTEWQFYIDPGEVVSCGHEHISCLSSNKAKRLYVVYDGVINKEIRIYNKNYKFVNPVYEVIEPDDAEPLNIFINSCDQPNYLKELLSWKSEKPHMAEVDYYLACQYLILKNYSKFLSHAEYFLFKESESIYQVIMMRYYLAQVLLHVKNNVQESIKNIIYCLSQKPLMAEFWCLLGDCYWKLNVKSNAKEFFRTAIEMGKSRQTDDSYPIEFTKYNEYPNKMLKQDTHIVN